MTNRDTKHCSHIETENTAASTAVNTAASTAVTDKVTYFPKKTKARTQ